MTDQLCYSKCFEDYVIIDYHDEDKDIKAVVHQGTNDGKKCSSVRRVVSQKLKRITSLMMDTSTDVIEGRGKSTMDLFTNAKDSLLTNSGSKDDCSNNNENCKTNRNIFIFENTESQLDAPLGQRSGTLTRKGAFRHNIGNKWQSEKVMKLLDIDTKPLLIQRKASVFLGTKREARRRCKIKFTKSTMSDEALKFHTYKKAIEALLYSRASYTPHKLELFSAQYPVFCHECNKMLYGLARQGLKCSSCGLKCHFKCRYLLPDDCYQQATKRSNEQGELRRKRLFSINKKMDEILQEKHETFEVLKSAFNINKEIEQSVIQSVKFAILNSSSNFSAKIVVSVLNARNLFSKGTEGTSNPYVTIQVGQCKYRTRTFTNSVDPVWNEEFVFRCHDMSDKIKVRAWHENPNVVASALHQKLTSEPDQFLGQVIYNVREVSGDFEVWKELEKRTEKSTVSGDIHLRVCIIAEGPDNLDSIYIQYTCLHESLFRYVYENQNGRIFLGSFEDFNLDVFFDNKCQEILDEFASNYKIEKVYKAMIHFMCLTLNFDETGVPGALSTLLANINAYHAYSFSTAKSTLDTPSFDRKPFDQVLLTLYNQIRSIISNYRVLYLSANAEKLSDLRSTIDLISNITFYRMKVLKCFDCQPTAQLLRECVKTCLETNYTFLFSNCTQLYDGTHESIKQCDEGVNSNESLDFWLKLIHLIAGVIEEDKNHYAKVFCQFPRELDIGKESACHLWKLFIKDLEKFLTYESKKLSCKDHMTLYFKVHMLFKNYVAHEYEKEDSAPRYATLFEPQICLWLKENSKLSNDIVFDAIELDNFEKISDRERYSTSIVDIATFLFEIRNILSSLELPCPKTELKILEEYTLLVAKVCFQYCQIILPIFEAKGHFSTEDSSNCIILNNIYQLSVYIQEMHEKSKEGDSSLGQQDTLKNLAEVLLTKIDKLCQNYSEFLEKDINYSCKHMQENLARSKDTMYMCLNHGDHHLEEEALLVMDPLITFLSKHLSIFYEHCSPYVLDKALQMSWNDVIGKLEDNVVLSKKLTRNRKKNQHRLTTRQLHVIRVILEIVEDFFHGEGKGLSRDFQAKSQCMKTLKEIIGMYQHTTSDLIASFIKTDPQQTPSTSEGVVGEIHIHVDVHRCSESNIQKIMVKISDCRNTACDTARNIRYSFEVHVLGPNIGYGKKCFNKRLHKNTQSLSREIMSFDIGNQENLDDYELQIVVKDRCIAHQDKLVGITVLPLGSIDSAANHFSSWIPIFKELSFTSKGKSILRVLSQRPKDELALEFVKLKLYGVADIKE